MEHTWRWFGPDDPITLGEIRQTGATGIVTALHEVPNGDVWPVEAIAERKRLIESAGLSWSVVESVPVHEDIKKRNGNFRQYIENYRNTLRNLATCGIDVVCFNFMPVLDWTRTDLAYQLADGGLALRFEQTAYAAFDLYILRRPGAERDYSDGEQTAAWHYVNELDEAQREELTNNIIAGLPGTEEHYTLERFREALAAYADIDAARLREHLRDFLKAVVPVAEEAGVRMGIHPDDPPRPLFGLPRVVSGPADVQWLLDAVPSPANGLTFCTGSYGVNEAIDLTDMAKRFAPHIYFAHLRSTQREAPDFRSFHEAGHLEGDVDMVGVIDVLVTEDLKRQREGGVRLPMRPDHGHNILGDRNTSTRPGYPLSGRMKGMAELRGIEVAMRRQYMRDD